MALQDIAKKIQVRLDTAAPGTASRDILELVSELVEVLQVGAGPDPRDAEIVALKAKVESLESLLNNDAATFIEIKYALGDPMLTQGALADEIRTKWRKI